MKNRFSLLWAFILLLAFSCDTDSDDDRGNLYSVSGQLLVSNKALENAVVTVDNSANWRTHSDADGTFRIEGVNPGLHNLSITYGDPEASDSESTFMNIDEQISVYDDVYLQDFKLPKPIRLLSILNASETSLKVSWEASDAPSFREYKIYRHTSSGLDETTGELVHVATSIKDTVFVDEKLAPVTQYFYRVYIMNEFGKMGGSNLLSNSTLSVNYVINGDFETGNNIFDFWPHSEDYGYYGTFGVFALTDTVKKNGNRCLALYADKEIYTYGHLLTRAQTLIGLKDGIDNKTKKYKLSYWIKTSGDISKDVVWFYSGEGRIAGIEGAICNPQTSGIKTTNTDWTYVEIIVPPSTCGIDGIYVRSFCTYAWIDDIRLEDVPD